jgi:hypothetical protein
MAFIRTRRHRGPDGTEQLYYALVESRRVRGRVQQRTLYSMGRNPTLADAIAELEGVIEYYQQQTEARRAQARAHTRAARQHARDAVYWQKKAAWLRQFVEPTADGTPP